MFLIIVVWHIKLWQEKDNVLLNPSSYGVLVYIGGGGAKKPLAFDFWQSKNFALLYYEVRIFQIYQK